MWRATPQPARGAARAAKLASPTTGPAVSSRRIMDSPEPIQWLGLGRTGSWLLGRMVGRPVEDLQTVNCRSAAARHRAATCLRDGGGGRAEARDALILNETPGASHGVMRRCRAAMARAPSTPQTVDS